MRRVLSVLLVLLLTLGAVSGSASAADAGDSPTAAEAPACPAAAEPTVITDALGLAAIRNDMSGSYVLGCDVDLTEALAEGGALYQEAGWIALGWDRVSGRRVDFTGTLDGAGHTVSGFFAAGPSAALFWSNAGTIRNLTLTGSMDSASPNTSFAAAGSFCCFNSGLIAGCVSAVTVNNLGKPNNYTGGIAGLNYSAGVIWDCTNTGSVQTGHTFEDNTGALAVGGIVGCNYGVVRGCGNTGAILAEVSATSENQFSAAWPYVSAGGVAGENTGTVERVWNRGSVTASYPYLKSYPAVAAGGVVGRTGTETRSAGESMPFVLRDAYNCGAIHAMGFHSYAGGVIGIYAPYSSQAVFRCYNAGLCTTDIVESIYSPAVTAAGAICGYERGAAELLTDCYYLDNMAEAVGTTEDHSCICLTDAQMQLQAAFVDYDFDQVWSMGTGDYLYPVLGRHVHELSHAEYLEETCASDGHTEYWFCPGCNRCWTDEDMEQELAWADTVLPGGHIYEQTAVTPPTCTEQGFTTHTCTRCGDSYADAWVEALGHAWSETVYTWNGDNTEVTAFRSCARDPAHTETETSATVYEVTLEPTYLAPGEGVFTAEFENQAFETQIRTVVLPRLELPCHGGDCPCSMFKDMPAKRHWAHDPIDWAFVNGITDGTSASTFSPNKGCTRAQVVTFLWRAAGSPAPTGSSAAMAAAFTDVKTTAYYYQALLWALEQGVTNGTSASTFSPNTICNRGQVVTFLWRAAGSPSAGEAAAAQAARFKDVRTAAYYYQALLWALEHGVTNGVTSTTFCSGDPCTRAHVVTFLYRAVTNE